VYTYISLGLACLFVFLAGFNVWNRVGSRGTSAHEKQLWATLHRLAGYAFIALFGIFVYFMLLRLKGLPDELPPRLILHMGLALVLAPLLVVKVLVARYQKADRGLLMGLGVGIFAIAFTLVALNFFVHYLRQASSDKVPAGMSAGVVALVLLSTSIAYVRKGQPLRPISSAGRAATKAPAQEASSRDQPLTLTLARIQPQTPHAKTLRFLVPRSQRILARPGQFLTFEWLIDGKTVTRSYSICSSPTQSGYVEITAKRVENGRVSQFLNDSARVGMTVTARGPYGRFCFEEEKHKRVVLIAGGSGVTPLMSMLRYIDDLSIPVDATLIYCVRGEEELFFKSELGELQSRGSRVVLVLSRPTSHWAGWTGRLRREILEREVEKPRESTFFLCGPPPFMELGRSLLAEMGVAPSQLLQESFGGAVAGQEVRPAAAGSLEITFSRSAAVCKAGPDHTVLESAESHGVLIPSGCRMGICGTCATKLLSGRVQMACEEALNDEMRSEGFILPCVSRPLGDVTLDA
jgi:3-phenylpropionate/trans-cinnamate dioxygenase ferredoxin reductase subunit